MDDLKKDFNKEIDYQMKKFGLASADFLKTFVKKLEDRKQVKVENRDTKITRPNGKIDDNFSQGHTGDCWLLAAIKGITQTPKGSDKNNVYLINPWDTSKTITVTRKQFKKFFNSIDEFDL